MTGDANHVPRIPTTPIEGPLWDHFGRDTQRSLLLGELEAAGVELGAYDREIADWLATWDWPTVVVVLSWLRRARCGLDGGKG